MRRWAIIGLLALSATASPMAIAHAPGVSHSYENGQPVITVRLVPEEATVANAKRIDALGSDAAHATPSDETGPQGAEQVETIEPAATEELGAPSFTEPTNELPAADAGPGTGAAAAVSRYPSVRPGLKPNTEIGVGGVLDLTPPAPQEADQPKPMRLNSVQRPRTVAERAPRQREQPRPRPPSVPAPRPSAPDPLDEALPSRVVLPEAVNAMQLPPPKAEERLAGGN